MLALEIFPVPTMAIRRPDAGVDGQDARQFIAKLTDFAWMRPTPQRAQRTAIELKRDQRI